MNGKKERKPLERWKLITTRGYELLINAQSKDTIPTRTKATTPIYKH
jgi:hypothetical protein